MRKMAMLRAVLLCALTAGACGDSDDDKEGGDNGGGNGGASGNGGSGGGASAGERDENGNCIPETSTCTQAEQDAYTDCLTTMCDAPYKKCLGDGYKTGNFGGPCGTFIECSNACDCDDTACTQACTPSSECTSCLTNDVSPCVQKCEIPECYTGGGAGLPEGGIPGAGKTCADLKACCDAKPAGQAKDTCNQLLMASQNMDIACGAYYTASSCE